MAFYKARESFAVTGQRVIAKGQTVSDTDPAYIGRENLFESIGDAVQRDEDVRSGKHFEAATAEPNERRSVTTLPTQDEVDQAKSKVGAAAEKASKAARPARSNPGTR
jgi:hypothetical protein